MKVFRTREIKEINISVTITSTNENEMIAREIRKAIQQMENHQKISYCITAVDFIKGETSL